MSREVYVKVGRRYKKLGWEFTGFPADGVWLVHDGHNSLIMKVGDLPDPMPLAQLQRHKDTALKAIMDRANEGPYSWSELWDTAMMAIAKEIEGDNGFFKKDGYPF